MANEEITKIKIAVDAPGASDALNRLRGGVDGLNASLKNTLAGAASLAKSFAVIGAAGAAAIGIKAIKDTAQLADEMGKAAQKVGTTTESLSKLKYASDLAGVSFEQLQTGLAKVAKTAEDARDGSKSARDAFAKIGIDPTKFKDTAQLFAAISDRFASMADGARKTAIAQELLGKSGAQLIPLLNGGGKGLSEMAAEAERLGIVIDEKTAKEAEQFNDDLSRLSAAAEGAKISFATKLFPALTDIAKASADAAREGGLLNGIWVGLGATMAHILGIDEASKLRESLKGVNQEIEKVQKQIASGSLNPEGASDRFWSFLVPDVKLNEKARQRLQKALEELQKERDNLVAAMQPVATADKTRVDAMTEQSELSAQAKEKETARIKTALESQKQALASAEKAFDAAKKKRADDIKEFQNLQKDLTAPAAGAPAKTIYGFQLDKAVEDASKAKDLAMKAPASEANQLAQDAMDKARVAGQLLKDYKAQQESTGSSIDANYAKIQVQRLGADLQNIVSQASGVQEKLSQDQLTNAQNLIQDTLNQAEALKNLVIGFDTDAATKGLNDLMEQLRNSIQANPIIVPVVPVNAANAANYTGVMDSQGRAIYRDPAPGYASGGMIRGPGSDRSDNLLAWLSPGEYVIRAAAVRKYGHGWFAALNNMRMPLPRYANGGVVESVQAARLSPVAARAAGQTGDTINITLPGVGKYQVKAASDESRRLERDLALAALKYGGPG